LQPRSFSYLGSLPGTPTGTTGLPDGYGQPYGAPGLVPSKNGSSNNWTPIPMLNSSNEMTAPQDTSLPGNLANSFTKPAFQVMGAFMDDIQVNFLLEATQMDKFSSIVQAPRIVMENGSVGYIAVQTDIPYVESIDVVVGEEAGGQEPTVEYMGFGTVLAVRASTRDLKYVNMYVVPQLTVRAADADLSISVPIVSAGSVGYSSYVYPGKRTTRVESLVSVPDGGTLLIGGLKQNGEVEIEAGPPVLSKMPVFKRFFSNKATTRDNFTLMVLVKPKIMVREEADPNMIDSLKLEKTSRNEYEF
jgi:type II secretory pathway component GspD/PulD (secretin)